MCHLHYCAIIPRENPIDDILCDRMRINFTRLQHLEFFRLVCNLANNARLPCNRGFTPNELADRTSIGERKTVSGVSVASSGKVFDSSEIGFMEIIHKSVITGNKVGMYRQIKLQC